MKINWQINMLPANQQEVKSAFHHKLKFTATTVTVHRSSTRVTGHFRIILISWRLQDSYLEFMPALIESNVGMKYGRGHGNSNQQEKQENPHSYLKHNSMGQEIL